MESSQGGCCVITVNIVSIIVLKFFHWLGKKEGEEIDFRDGSRVWKFLKQHFVLRFNGIEVEFVANFSLTVFVWYLI